MNRTAYSIVILPSVFKDVRRIPRDVALKLDERILALRSDPFPSGAKKMEGHVHRYRIRFGDYRIIYDVAAQIRIITVVRVGNRKQVYRRM